MKNYLILTDDRETKGTFTRWAECPKDNLYFLKQLIDYFKTCNKPEIFIIYDAENNTAHRLIDCKIMEVTQ